MASADLRDELDCSICLTTYTDPVTLRCGHNFCRVCVDRVLDTQDESGVYSCPECREVFADRPALRKNIALCNIVRNFLFTPPAKEWTQPGIRCTYCVDSPVPAVKSCLHCEASLCDKHLRVHSKSAEHILTEPSTSLENRKCPVHKKILEYYCTEDAACICVSCSLAGEHRGHQVEMLDEASEKKKEKLRNVLQKLTTKREETEERVQSLEEHWRKAQEKASGEAERVTALFIDIRRRLDDLEKRVLSDISRREEQVSLSLSDVIQKLEIKKDELSGKMRHIEELCNMTDPLTVLQEPDTGDLCDPEEEGGDEDTGRHDKHLHDVDLDFISEIIHKGLLDIVDKEKPNPKPKCSFANKMFANHNTENATKPNMADASPGIVLPTTRIYHDVNSSGSFLYAAPVPVKQIEEWPYPYIDNSGCARFASPKPKMGDVAPEPALLEPRIYRINFNPPCIAPPKSKTDDVYPGLAPPRPRIYHDMNNSGSLYITPPMTETGDAAPVLEEIEEWTYPNIDSSGSIHFAFPKPKTSDAAPRPAIFEPMIYGKNINPPRVPPSQPKTAPWPAIFEPMTYGKNVNPPSIPPSKPKDG